MRRNLQKIVLFGAGHVGKALVKLLQDLPFLVEWVDERADLFPQEIPDNAVVRHLEDPLEVLDNPQSGVFYVVMTHSHGLDYELCLKILQRREFGWLGLIGSETKRKRFEKRFIEDGVDSFYVAAFALSDRTRQHKRKAACCYSHVDRSTTARSPSGSI